ncbi:MAG: hypothetical protein V3W44_07005 [Dehalococcoidales bacterium]
MNYGELKLQIADTVHRSDLTAVIPAFIEATRTRLNRDLRVQAMINTAEITPTTNPFTAPADFLEMREISRGAQNSTGRVILSSVGRHMLNRYKFATGNSSQFYSVDGYQIEVAPNGVDIPYSLIYYAEIPEFVSDSDETPTLTRYPSLWLYGALYEAYNYTANREAQTVALQDFTSEITAANKSSAMAETSESPMMNGAALWGW